MGEEEDMKATQVRKKTSVLREFSIESMTTLAGMLRDEEQILVHVQDPLDTDMAHSMQTDMRGYDARDPLQLLAAGIYRNAEVYVRGEERAVNTVIDYLRQG